MQYCARKLESCARDTIEVIRKPPVAPIPTVSDVLEHTLKVRALDRTLRGAFCDYDLKQVKVLGEFEFCHACDICVR